jgi:hypothetical protein
MQFASGFLYCYTVSDLKRPVVTDLSSRGMILPTGRLGRGTLQAGGTSITSTSSLDDDPRLVGGKYCAVGNLSPFYFELKHGFCE